MNSPSLKTSIWSLIFLSLSIVFPDCKKPDSQTQTPNQPPVTPHNVNLEIKSVAKTDINEVDLEYSVKPEGGDKYSNIKIGWSTTADFTTDDDSTTLADNTSVALDGKYHLVGLKQATTYYARLSIIRDNKLTYSETKQFETDSLKITFDTDIYPIRANRNIEGNYSLFTNFTASPQVIDPDTSVVKLLLGNYECKISSDEGYLILYNIPENVPPADGYTLTLVRKHLTGAAPAPVNLMRGLWSEVQAPDVPLAAGTGYENNGIGFYGTCHSDQKGYMIGGVYLHPLSISGAEAGGPFVIREFDGQTLQWAETSPVNPRLYENPICYYYNNSIYVIGGKTRYPTDGDFFVKTMWRLDLASMTWISMDTLPYPGIFNQASFELDGEWYIGMGLDSANRSLCCGDPLPSKKFWKYSPSTNIWTQLADFPGGSMNYPSCFTIGSEAYAFYGAIPNTPNPGSETDYSEELWKYNPVMNQWTQISIPSNGPPPGEKYQIFAYNGKAYFLTGQLRVFDGSSYSFNGPNPSLEYDPVSNTFSQVATNSTGGILQLLYSKDDKFYFQADAFGYITNIPNKTNLFIPDK
ncbi:MAG TPA: hypothetical protein VGQ53_25195 [Chitinophagaceae bacterium]|nr:hypothetical protein [Chitinophagaceae bacterium]